MPISLVLLFLTGLLFSGLAIPLMRRKIKPNSWYGIRVPKAMESESIWYEVNAIMGRYLFAFGLLVSIISLQFILHPLEYEYEMVYILLGTLILGTILFVKLSFSTANKISQRKFN